MLSINDAAKRLRQPYLLITGFVHGMALPLQKQGNRNLMSEESFLKLKKMVEVERYNNINMTPIGKSHSEGEILQVTPDEMKAHIEKAVAKALKKKSNLEPVAVGEDSGEHPVEAIPEQKKVAKKAAAAKSASNVLKAVKASNLFAPGGEAGPKKSLARKPVKSGSGE